MVSLIKHLYPTLSWISLPGSCQLQDSHIHMSHTSSTYTNKSFLTQNSKGTLDVQFAELWKG